MRNRTLLVAGLGLLFFGIAGMVLGGVGAFASAPTSMIAGPTAQAATTPSAAPSPFMGTSDPNAEYDLRFIDEMSMHHQGAIMSAQVMIGGSKRPELRDLASRIEKGQQKQLDQMQAWRKQWYPNAPKPTMTTDMMGAGGMGSASGGMMSGSSNSGMMGSMMVDMMGGQDASDRMFLRMMIPHHQLAIDMAQDALKNAQRAELKTLAQQIVNDQSAEIKEMEGYLLTWYGEPSTRDTAQSMREMMQRVCKP
ncbi:MAG: DUF305 domain-containing protein [Chloroflexi bacterium]|nr:DUF305 domain-containing protein [Chloroflexota bacterium]